MECPNITKFQSIKKGQKRLNQAIDFLGSDVANKILAFSLYILGYPYDFISNAVGLSEPGLKTLIQDLYENGVERFLDKRKKVTYPNVKKPSLEPINPEVKYIEHEEKDEFKLSGPISLKIGKDDRLGKKILTLFLVNADLLKQIDAAKILKCKRTALYQSLKKVNSVGTKGLIDNRRGQRSDYKYDSKVKGEIVKAYLLSILSNKMPTKTSISEHLHDKFLGKYSQEAVSSHLKKLGLSDSKNELLSKIVQHINKRINSLEYIKIGDRGFGTEYERCLELLKKFKEELSNCYEIEKEQNFFELEKRVESFQSKSTTITVGVTNKSNEGGIYQMSKLPIERYKSIQYKYTKRKTEGIKNEFGKQFGSKRGAII